jgi:hypothetical protein
MKKIWGNEKMGEDVGKLLKNFVGKNVNLSFIGDVSTLIYLENFDCWLEKHEVYSDRLVFRNDITEQEVYIDLDEIHSMSVDDGKNEIVMVRENGNIVQIFLNV